LDVVSMLIVSSYRCYVLVIFWTSFLWWLCRH